MAKDERKKAQKVVRADRLVQMVVDYVLDNGVVTASDARRDLGKPAQDIGNAIALAASRGLIGRCLKFAKPTLLMSVEDADRWLAEQQAVIKTNLEIRREAIATERDKSIDQEIDAWLAEIPEQKWSAVWRADIPVINSVWALAKVAA